MTRTGAAILGIALLGATASRVNAVELNPDGSGQVLIYPYYTVNADNSTLLSVVNTRDRSKIVRFRFKEGYNGMDVMLLDVALSPFDVSTASLFSLSADGSANLLTDDESCTIPDIKGAAAVGGIAQLPAPDGRSYVRFRNGEYQTDGGPKTIDRTREGSIEMMEMATIQPGSPIEQAITHVNGVPPNCAGLTSIVFANTADLRGPAGGLFGSVNIVNSQLGTLVGYNADSVDGFFLLDSPLLTSSASSTLPSLADARTTTTTAVAYTYAPTSVDGPSNAIVSTYSTVNAIDAVSAIFTSSGITNEYVIEATSASESEWVISFPTKKYYVNSTPPIAPFLERFAAPGRSCVKVGVQYFDREQLQVTVPIDFNGLPFVPTTQLCYQTSVLTFQNAADYIANHGVSAVLGSRLTSNLNPRANGFSSGWLRMDLDPTDVNAGVVEPHALRPSIDLDVFHGLPVTGFLATNYLNRNNGGPNVLSTYSTSGRHRASRNCSNATTGGNGFCS
ncbi:MAG: hypothetical protein ABI411_11005 [Tahibacter sp.]